MCFIIGASDVIINLSLIVLCTDEYLYNIGLITMSIGPFGLSPIMSETNLHCVSMVHSSVLSLASDSNCISAVLSCAGIYVCYDAEIVANQFLCQYFCPSSIWLGGGSRSSQFVTVLGDAAYNT